MEKKISVNTEIYNSLGDRWYSADDDPVALLRSQSKTIAPWVVQKIQSSFGERRDVKILDVGCGAGFLSNRLAVEKYDVTGLDLSQESLDVAKRHDATGSVQYRQGDAMNLPFKDESFEVISAMDFLEHVEDPENLVKEIGRVLKPNGLFLYHTFNRNFLSRVVIIKFVEWFVKNTPHDLHLHRLFVKPGELKEYCKKASLEMIENVGIRPEFSTIRWRHAIARSVPKNFKFTLTKSLSLSYIGYARKQENAPYP
jgi:2-polyprenyl-6-hydroxyphenyl methylase/3-demethylubiquinone-9 3-methyltransferase